MALQTDVLTQELLKHYQRDFPIVSRPFQAMSETLSYTADQVLSRLIELKQKDIVTRIGPIFDHKRAGASLLAAVSVPKEKLNMVAEQINCFAEVNHNYGREHHFNLWFVVTAPNKTHLDQSLAAMELTIGYPILRLPMVKSYYIDLGFQVSHEKLLANKQALISPVIDENNINRSDLLCETDQHRLRVLIQDGLPLVQQPFKELAGNLGFATENQVLNTLKSWLKSGLVKRIGLITNHHNLGYTSNAMVVWNVPDHLIDEIGEKIKQSGLVSLCYQRERRLPEWQYNLYCMIHSRDRDNVAEQVAKLEAIACLNSLPSEILYTTQQYKQKGGLYSVASDAKKSPVSAGSIYKSDSTKQVGMM